MTEPRWHAAIERVVLALALVWLLALAVVFALRVGFPLELEWMEGGILHQALRLQRGESLYPPPGPDFVPFLYTPLYAIVVGALGLVFPLDYALGRVVSILAVVAIAAAIVRAVRREGKPRTHQIAAVGLFASGYVFGFRWLDLARPDTMFLALVVWALVLLRESWGDARKAALAGVLMALAFWTKQTATVFVLASGVGALLVAPRQLWIYAAVIAVLDGGVLWLANARSEGLLWHYVFELHQAHRFNHERFARKTWAMFVHAAPWLTVLVAWLVIRFVAPWGLRARKLGGDDQRLRARLSAHRGLLYWSLMALASALVSALGYSTQWAEPNAFLPGILFGAVWIGVALPGAGRAQAIALGLVGAQLSFALLLEPRFQPLWDRGLAGLRDSYAWQSLERTIPSTSARADAAALREQLQAQRRELLALQRPWWSVIAGGTGHVGSMGIADLEPADRKAVESALAQRVRDGEYDELWFEGEPPPWLRAALRGRYKVVERRQGRARVRPMSGWMSEAGVVTAYVADQVRMAPIIPAEIPEGAQVLADFEDGTLQGVTTHGGYGRRPVAGFTGELPQPAGYGGEFWLSSGGASGQLDAKGEAVIGPVSVAAGDALQLAVGVVGRPQDDRGCTVVVVDAQDVELARLGPIGGAAVLQPQRWTATAAGSIRLRVRDEDPAAACVLDDVWLIAAATP
ncbi:MAG: hypothetical protein K1X88_12940 [Nannocystaceae bacterium]|nr:hypothetical protein [Nannocystaceae bacterium]